MRGLLMAMCVVLVLGCCGVGPAWADEAGGKAWGGGAVEAKAPADVTPAAAGERLGILQRRRLGLTIENVRETTKKLLSDGTIDKQMPKAVIAAAVMDSIMAQNTKAWEAEAKVEAPDWDAIFAFIEKLIELFMKFAPLFLG